MNVSNVSQNEFESMFGGNTIEPQNTTGPTGSGFSYEDPKSTMFEKQTPALEPVPGEEPKVIEEKPIDPDASLFNEEPKVKEKDAFDIKSYFENKIKEGSFLAFEDDKLETPEDVDALIEANFTHKLEKVQEELENNWYGSKSNAWKFVAQYADNVDNPYDLLPLLQGIQNIEAVHSLDPGNPEQAEIIVRAALQRRGESPSIIEDQITTFKEGNKLEKLAADYQPILIQEENQKLAQLQAQKEQQDQNNLQMIHDIHENAIRVIETPFLGKHKLKKEEKAAVYDLIAQPEENAGGFKIFKAIDNLYEIKDFDTLREIALLVNKKSAYRNYIGLNSTDVANEKILRKLKDVQTSSTTSTKEEPNTPRLQRPTTQRNESGFGFFNR